jgi:acyl-CoA thioesterase-1
MMMIRNGIATYGGAHMPMKYLRPALTALAALASLALPASADPVRIVALGDSLTAGYGLAADESFVHRLEAALRARGHDVVIVDAGVSGDTASDGLARVDWSVGDDADAVIVELGANDALRGVDPAVTRDALDRLVGRLAQRGLPVLLAGMVAPPNLGADYGAAFNPIYADVAARHGAVLYPFFLDGVAARPDLNQADGIHPNAEGVAIVVDRIVPSVEALLARVARPATQGAVRPPSPPSLALKGDTPCRDFSPASRFPPRSASGWRFFAAGFPAPAGSTVRTTT